MFFQRISNNFIQSFPCLRFLRFSLSHSAPTVCFIPLHLICCPPFSCLYISIIATLIDLFIHLLSKSVAIQFDRNSKASGFLLHASILCDIELFLPNHLTTEWMNGSIPPNSIVCYRGSQKKACIWWIYFGRMKGWMKTISDRISAVLKWLRNENVSYKGDVSIRKRILNEWLEYSHCTKHQNHRDNWIFCFACRTD